MGRTDGRWPIGVQPLDHTADVGLRADADSLAALFERMAAGMCVMVEGEGTCEDGPESGALQPIERNVEVEAPDVALLLVAWLREILHLHQVEGLAFGGAAIERIEEATLRARVSLRPARSDPVREIKGVTYHGLQATRRAGTWHARVIFDV